MSYEKGLSLELIISDLFRKNGYDVIHNLKKKGKSGVEHQIDVYAEYQAPLHTSSLIIEAKNYEGTIDKDMIMKFIQIVDDLNVDRGIFVTTSEFVASAELTASQYNNIELWNRDKIAKLVGEMQLSSSSITSQENSINIKTDVKMISPKLSLGQIKVIVIEQIQKKSKGGFLGVGKIFEEVKNIQPILYPYYDLNIQVNVKQEEKTGFRKTETVEKIIQCKVSVDAIFGGIVDALDTIVSYQYALPQVSEEESKFLRKCRKGFEMKYVIGMGSGEAKMKRLVNGLVSKGILNASSTRPVFYSLRLDYPENPSLLHSLSYVHPTTMFTSDGAKILESKIEPHLIIKMVENYLDAKVENINIVYYPYYQVEYGREDNSLRVEILDGISGNANNALHVS